MGSSIRTSLWRLAALSFKRGFFLLSLLFQLFRMVGFFNGLESFVNFQICWLRDEFVKVACEAHEYTLRDSEHD